MSEWSTTEGFIYIDKIKLDSIIENLKQQGWFNTYCNSGEVKSFNDSSEIEALIKEEEEKFNSPELLAYNSKEELLYMHFIDGCGGSIPFEGSFCYELMHNAKSSKLSFLKRSSIHEMSLFLNNKGTVSYYESLDSWKEFLYNNIK